MRPSRRGHVERWYAARSEGGIEVGQRRRIRRNSIRFEGGGAVRIISIPAKGRCHDHSQSTAERRMIEERTTIRPLPTYSSSFETRMMACGSCSSLIVLTRCLKLSLPEAYIICIYDWVHFPNEVQQSRAQPVISFCISSRCSLP
jgi:hypothetical protein